jgi:hypothetical protein
VSTLAPILGGSRVGAWAWWALPVIALAAVLGWETDWGRSVVRVPASPPPVEPKAITAAVLPDYQIEGGLAAHAETVNRTLFNATRRPAPSLAGDGAPQRLAANQFQLMGTTVTGDRNIAFLKEIAGGKARTVRQGEEINGMLVASVEPDRVKFTVGDESEELVLKVAPGPKTTLVAAPRPPAPAGAVAAPGAPRAGSGRPGRAAQAPAAAAAAGGQPMDLAAARASRRAARAAGQGANGQTPRSAFGAGMGAAGRAQRQNAGQ